MKDNTTEFIKENNNTITPFEGNFLNKKRNLSPNNYLKTNINFAENTTKFQSKIPKFKTEIVENSENTSNKIKESKYRGYRLTNKLITFFISFFRNFINEKKPYDIMELKRLDGTQGKVHKNVEVLKLFHKTLGEILSAKISRNAGKNLFEYYNVDPIKKIIELKNDLSDLLNKKLFELLHHFGESKKIEGKFYDELKKEFDEKFKNKFGGDNKYEKHLKNHLKYIDKYYLVRVRNQLRKSTSVRKKKIKEIKEILINIYISKKQKNPKNNNNINIDLNDYEQVQIDFRNNENGDVNENPNDFKQDKNSSFENYDDNSNNSL